MKLKIAALLLVSALATAAASLAAGGPIVEKPVATGNMLATTIHGQTGGMVLDSIKIKPGGSFGWHTHSAPVAVVITGGTLTVFDPSVNKCAPFKVSKGQSFVEPANHVHLARNDGKATATLYALYLGIPKGKPTDIPAGQPAGCSA